METDEPGILICGPSAKDCALMLAHVMAAGIKAEIIEAHGIDSVYELVLYNLPEPCPTYFHEKKARRRGQRKNNGNRW